MDKIRANGGNFDSMKNYGTFDHVGPNETTDDMFEMFTAGPFHR